MTRITIDRLLAALPALRLVQDDILTGPPLRIFGVPLWPGPEVAVVARDAVVGSRYTMHLDGTVTHTYPNGNTVRAVGLEQQLDAVLTRMRQSRPLDTMHPWH